MHLSIDHLRDGGVLPLERYASGEFAWQEHREAFFRGFHLSLGAYAQSGNDLIVEHIIEKREWKELLVDVFKDIDIFFVGIHCPVEELERREKLRGDRPLGGARKDFETIHAFNCYDLEIDGTLPPEENAELVISAWLQREDARIKPGESSFMTWPSL